VFFKAGGAGRQVYKLDQIIIACIRDEKKNKEWMYKYFYGYIMAVILRYVKQVDIAEELVNDSFIKMFRHLARFRLPDDPAVHLKAFKGWIARIASRTAIDFLKVNKNHHYSEEIKEETNFAESVNVIDKMQFQDILALLDDLPEIQRIIFNMFEMEGYSHQEISETLSIPIKNSRVYLARAKKHLRQLYQNSLYIIGYAS
jgi:RNA polymerase sigma factor (sigma-70 family)